MLNYRNAAIGLACIAALSAFLRAAVDVSLWWFCIPLGLYVTLLAYGSANIRSSFFIETSSNAPTELHAIGLTFDDGPLPVTSHILKILGKHNAKATFFCIGKRVLESPNVLKEIDAAGHTVGNHSFSHHLLFDLFSTNRLIVEIEETDQAIEAVLGKRPIFFRPPYGVTTPNLARAIKKTGHHCIGWSVRSMDTVIKEEQKLLGNMQAALKPGAVFLFHDSSVTTANILDDFLKSAKQAGFCILPLDQLLNINSYA